MLGLDVAVEPLRELRDVSLTWYIGLDADGTRIGDALWKGEAIASGVQSRVIALFRLNFTPSVLAGGGPVYLILAMSGEKKLRLKPQNLLTGLPTRRLASSA
jgi:hypothetical protein